MARTWMVAYDFSEQAERALARAADDLASMGGGEILLVHVHPPLSTGFGFELSGATGFQDVDRALENETRERLGGVAKQLRASFATIEVGVHVQLGRPADTLAEIPRREGVDLIVIGSHGRRGLERFFLGSVAERVLRLAECPVLVVKAPSEATP
jgi:nucleotide-binding universal stress UspA family protein